MRKIIHIDMDCFFAAVEMRDHPELKNIPIGIGGGPHGRGVLCTCNYLARSYGVRSAMPSFMAIKKCPELKFIPPNFEKYKEASQKIHEIFQDYTDLIEPLSIDEAYLDVTHSDIFHGSATLIAKDIKRRIKEELQLTASAGVAPNKFLAKIASDWRKPDGLFVITPKDVPSFVKRLQVSKISGVGKVTAKHLEHHGIKNCGDLEKYTLSYLHSKFGKLGEMLYYRSRGIDNRSVSPHGPPKSVSVENTFAQDLKTFSEWENVSGDIFAELLGRYEKKLEKYGAKYFDIEKFFIKVKYNDFSIQTMEKKFAGSSLRQLVDDEKHIYYQFLEMLKMMFEKKDMPVRLLGLGFRLHSVLEESAQLCLFDGFIFENAA